MAMTQQKRTMLLGVLGLLLVGAVALLQGLLTPAPEALQSSPVARPLPEPDTSTPVTPPVQTADPGTPGNLTRDIVPSVSAGADLSQGVRGHVVGPDGRPLAAARAYLLESGSNDLGAMWRAMQNGVPFLPAAATTTAGDGLFELGLSKASGSRDYEVRILAGDFADVRLANIKVQPGDWYDAGTVTMLPGTLVRGRVVLAGTTLPVPQAVITLLGGNAFDEIGAGSLPERAQGLQTHSDQNGVYELRSAPRSGVCSISALAPGFARITRPQIELAGQPLQVDFELPRGQSLQGEVVDAGGRGITDARVQVFPHAAGEPRPFETFTDASGHFTVLGLRDGNFRVRVQARSWQSADVAKVEVPGAAVHVQLDPLLQARARVSTPEGVPVARFVLSVRRFFADHGGQLANVPGQADLHVRGEDLTDGIITVPGLGAGSYVFHVQADGFAKTESASFNLAVGDGEPLIDVVLTRGATLLGTVVDERGTPVAAATVETQGDGAVEDNPMYRTLMNMTPQRISRAQVSTDADGRFRLPLLAFADYQLKITHPDHCDAIQAGVHLAEPGEQQLAAIVLQRGTVVRGRATLDGVAAGQIKIVVEPPAAAAAAARVRAETISKNDGSFEFQKRLPPGNYELRACQQAGDADGNIFTKILQLKQSAVPITILPGQDLAEQTVNITTNR
jgi:hypothetical protein